MRYNISTLISATIFALHIFLCIEVHAQGKGKKIELRNANSLEFDDRIGNKSKRLIGNVILEQENVLMYCDSAYLYENNTIDAFGNIRITQGSSLNLYGDFLKYDGNTKKAEVHRNVRMIDDEFTLATELLYYDLGTKMASYVSGGKVTSKETVLTSEKGYYISASREFYFKKNVVLTNPEYVMECDTLKYKKDNKTAYFFGPSTIKGKDNFIYCENGWYDTNKNISRFSKKAYIISKDQKLVGDSIFYDRKNNNGKAFGNVQIIDTTQKITIKGDYVQNSNNNKKLLVTGHALLIQDYGTDTLFLHADTLRAEFENGDDKSDGTRVLFAYNKVKFFKTDMQGKCDSLVYRYSDSTMNLYHSPVLWSSENQLTADKMTILTSNGKLFTLDMINTALIVSMEDSSKYNQIKGKQMRGYFTENKLTSIKVKGNGQTIYYAKDKDKYIGVNRAECSDLLIRVKENKVQAVTFFTMPDATMYPMNELGPKELLLKDFAWKAQYRPLTQKDIFRW